MENAVLELYFPFKGISQNLAFKNQTPLTSPILLNVRLRDVAENRARGGQRPGMSKAFDEQVGGNQPVLKMIRVNTTYISPEE